MILNANDFVSEQDGEEEFIRVDFVQGKPHVVLLAGGNFCKGTGRYISYHDNNYCKLN